MKTLSLLPLLAALVLAGCASPRADNKAAPVAATAGKPGAPSQTIRVQTWFIEMKTDTSAAQALADELEEKTGMKKIGGNAGILAAAQAKAFWADLKALGQVEILSAPTVSVASGNRASITIGQEMRYPTRWGADEKKNAWTPLDFATRQVGVEAAVEPRLRDDGRIRLALEATATELDGFVRTDKPAQASLTAPTDVVTLDGKSLGTQGPVTPVFSVRNVKTQITLRPGETLVLQGSRQTVSFAEGHDGATLTRETPSETGASRASFILVTASPETPPTGPRIAP